MEKSYFLTLFVLLITLKPLEAMLTDKVPNEEKGTSHYPQNPQGGTILHKAVVQNNLKCVKAILVHLKYLVHSTNGYKQTPLTLAIDRLWLTSQSYEGMPKNNPVKKVSIEAYIKTQIEIIQLLLSAGGRLTTLEARFLRRMQVYIPTFLIVIQESPPELATDHNLDSDHQAAHDSRCQTFCGQFCSIL